MLLTSRAITQRLFHQTKKSICSRISLGSRRISFDNEQVAGKRWVVSLENPNVPISVVTNHGYLQMEKNSTIQMSSDLWPKYWMIKPVTKCDWIELSNFNEQFAYSLRFSRISLIEKRLEYVKQRQIKIKKDRLECYEDLINHYTKKLEEAKTEKICFECGASNDFTYRKCTNYEGKIEKNVVNNNLGVLHQSRNLIHIYILMCLL